MSRRTEMLGSTIQRELAMIILRELSDPRLTGLPSITRVRVSPDLSVADVYLTVMGTPGQQSAALAALRHSAGLMRGRLNKSLSLRMAPLLKFHLDENLKKSWPFWRRSGRWPRKTPSWIAVVPSSAAKSSRTTMRTRSTMLKMRQRARRPTRTTQATETQQTANLDPAQAGEAEDAEEHL